ncbi:MAG: hypothetical protein ACD_49C00019G0001 [uncultured bacterium (gcode 4)]|uniref:Uncharacterized protein n=1 Tax=uncultured bacterium (gcode 4) TaxID=1234023 RepID=K2BD93_9BACT|nr:MAG: hypothetical protein ACD_49C00019G0001 [uncultured bacterium (gcode 4)]
MKKIIKIVLVTIFLIPILWVILILIWWMPWMSFEVPWYKLTETYLTMWDYSIWKQKFQYNICHKKEGCIEGKILWLKEKNNDIYIYYKLNYWTFSSIDKISKIETIDGFRYEFFKKSNRITVYSLNNLPKYWFLSKNELKFYSENDLEKLDKGKQDIFKELVNNPKIIINWVDYSR